MIVSLCNLRGNSATLMLMCRSNFGAIKTFSTPIFTRSCGKADSLLNGRLGKTVSSYWNGLDMFYVAIITLREHIVHVFEIRPPYWTIAALCVIQFGICEYHDLTLWDQYEMVAILHMPLSKAYSWIDIVSFWSKFQLNLFSGVQLAISQHWFRRQSIIWGKHGIVPWHT